MELFAKIVFAKSSILHVWKGSENILQQSIPIEGFQKQIFNKFFDAWKSSAKKFLNS